MLGRSSSTRVAIAGMLGGAMASVGSALRNAGNTVIGIPSAPRINENGLPVHERTPRTSGKSISVAQGKRDARKARNVKRNRRAHK
jgi:hypothetical protein